MSDKGSQIIAAFNLFYYKQQKQYQHLIFCSNLVCQKLRYKNIYQYAQESQDIFDNQLQELMKPIKSMRTTLIAGNPNWNSSNKEHIFIKELKLNQLI